ncbi:MAG: GNAT family N-acetyltransferase [Nitrolancea sp.]
MTQEAHNSYRESFGFRIRVEPITIPTLSRLRLSWSSRFDREDIGRLVKEHPGLSQWIPDTGDYVVGGPWRHRSEIAAVMELSSQSGAVPLLEELRESAAASGKRLVIASEHHESRQQAFYQSAGYDLIEEILIYELNQIPYTTIADSRLRFEPVDLKNAALTRELIELDHRSFPWLWWNSRAEFDNYVGSFGVNIYLGRNGDGKAVSYLGVTRFRNWGHLDRIAVDPTVQGRGLGLESLDWAVHMLAESGARRIGLSTQARNVRSRQLYERYGFRRSPSQDYALYGQWLTDPEPM